MVVDDTVGARFGGPPAVHFVPRPWLVGSNSFQDLVTFGSSPQWAAATIQIEKIDVEWKDKLVVLQHERAETSVGQRAVWSMWKAKFRNSNFDVDGQVENGDIGIGIKDPI